MIKSSLPFYFDESSFFLKIMTCNFLFLLQIPATTVRILLNHFKWDKEKLMERYYSDEQDAMFAEAR